MVNNTLILVLDDDEAVRALSPSLTGRHYYISPPSQVNGWDSQAG